MKKLCFLFLISKESADAKVLKLRIKWQTLYIPDLNEVFAIPCPDASYKLLDRIVVVRSGYPVSEFRKRMYKFSLDFNSNANSTASRLFENIKTEVLFEIIEHFAFFPIGFNWCQRYGDWD